MGRDKASLPFGDETMLQRVVRLVGDVVELVCVAAGPEQPTPPLPLGIFIARDNRAERGPLEGLLTGLDGLQGRVDAVFVTGCDAPLLEPRLIERMFELLGDADAAAPLDGDRVYPLPAVFRATVRKVVLHRLANHQLAMKSLLDEISTRRIPVDALRDVDPRLQSLFNVNSHEDHLAALELAGLGTTPASDSVLGADPQSGR